MLKYGKGFSKVEDIFYETKANEVYYDGNLILKGKIVYIKDKLLNTQTYPQNTSTFYPTNYEIIIKSPLFNHYVLFIGDSVNKLVDEIYEAELGTDVNFRWILEEYIKSIVEWNRLAHKEVD